MNEDLPLIDIRQDHWQIVRAILRKCVPEYEVWAFGSRVAHAQNGQRHFILILISLSSPLSPCRWR